MPWEEAAYNDRLVAEIVVNRPVDSSYHYLVPNELRDMIGIGQRVKVSFGRGNRRETAYCVGLSTGLPTSRKLKSIEEIIDREPLLSEQMLQLSKWIAHRYLCGWGQVLNSLVPAGVKKKSGTRELTFFQIAKNKRDASVKLKLPAKQQAIFDVLLAANTPMRGEELATTAGCGSGPIQTLRKKGIIEVVRQRTSQFEADVGFIEREADLQLNQEQAAALKPTVELLQAGEHKTILLHGVTGSGKTEVYIQAIREVVGYGKQAILLVPEISLTPQTIRRFRARFDSVAVLHSHLSDAERHWYWQQISRGEVQVVVGARSAVFAPVPHLGLIVIDEEHETSFKQDITPRYHAREVARKRAEMEKIPLILGSATPTLESWQRVLEKKDMLLTLSNRVASLPLPPVVVVDIRNDPQISKGASLGRALTSAMRLALNDGGQVILFLNLRGYSTALWCRACGDCVRCPNCDITLTWHKDKNVALCHSCGHESEVPKFCPNCDHAGIRYVGAGTQRLEQEVKTRFPEFKCLRMDSDSMRKPGSHDKALESFRHGEVQILLGTQMIAKGLDFPNVTLVGVVAADTMLHQPDLRASERTFQLIAQVAGRTGRSIKGGRVFVQTTSPTEPAISFAAKHDYLGFVHQELLTRKEMQVTPYCHLTRVIFRGLHEHQVRDFSKEVASILKKKIAELQLNVSLLGPAPAPIAKLKQNYRYHLRLASKTLSPIQELWRAVVKKIPSMQGVEFVIDVDPVNMR